MKGNIGKQQVEASTTLPSAARLAKRAGNFNRREIDLIAVNLPLSGIYDTATPSTMGTRVTWCACNRGSTSRANRRI